jgi:hypothetical protein
MKYMLMMNVPRGTGDYQISNWSPDELKAHMEFMHRLNKEMADAGERVDAQGLTPPAQAKLVRAGKGGAPVTDGVFPESKEFLAGYWIVDVESPERAYQLAAKASSAPGPGGRPLNLAIEVRPLAVLNPPPDQR